MGPSIKEVLEAYPDRAAVCGIDEIAIASMMQNEAIGHVEDARRLAKDSRLLIVLGCVILVATSEVNLKAAVQASRHNIC